MKINGKTLALGIVLGLAAAMVMGAMGAGPASEGPGRYQITSTAVYAWVIDTQTGQVWTVERRDDNKPSFVAVKPVEWADYGTPVKEAGR
jgi:hypothetical protein